MEVVVLDTPEQCGAVVADIMATAVARGAGQPTTLGLATGSSPLLAYRELVRRSSDDGLSFAGVRAVLLDEYVGLPTGHPESYREVIRREFTGQVDLDDAHVHGPDGAAADPLVAAEAYEQLLRDSPPVAVQLLGIGANGHIGFNEPGSSLRSVTRVKTLTEQTRRDNARFFASPDEVPMHVITQGLGTIGRARAPAADGRRTRQGAGRRGGRRGPAQRELPRIGAAAAPARHRGGRRGGCRCARAG